MNNILKNTKQTRIETPNENDSISTAEEIVKHKKVLIRARYPGSGKTYTRQQKAKPRIYCVVCTSY